MERVKVRLANKLRTPRTLILEPWAHELPFPPETTYLLVAEGDLGYAFEIEFGEEDVTVYAHDNAGARLELYAADGEQLF